MLRALFILFFVGWTSASAQNSLPQGYPIVTNYDHRVSYSGTAQAFGLAEDDRGIIYFGNNVHGIQVWNGVRWDKVPLTSSRAAFSLLWHPDERRMYYSTDFTFGYLKISKQGEYIPVDLDEYLDTEDIILERFNKMRYWNGKILIKSPRQLLSWDGENVSILFQTDTNNTLNRLHIAGNAFWFHVGGEGMFRGDENGIEPFHLETPDGNPFAIGVFDTDEGISFVTRTACLIHFDGEQFRFANAGKPLLPNASLNRVIQTTDGSYAMADGRNGIYFFHTDGSPDVHMTESHGLPTNQIDFLFEDSSGNIWASGALGASIIEYASPLRILAGEEEVPVGSNMIALHRNELFTGGSNLHKWDGEQKKWITLKDIPNRIIHMRSDGHVLTALSQAGILQYSGGKIYHTYKNRTYDLSYSQRYNDLLMVIGSVYLKFFLLDESGIIQRKIHEIDMESIAFSIHEDAQGRLWIGTGNRGIIRISYSRYDDRISINEFRRFDTEDGLPPGNFLYTFKVNDSVFFTTSLQTYAFDEDSGTFHPHTAFEKPFDFHIKTPWPTVQDDYDRLWIDLTGRQLGFLDLTTEPPHEWTYLPFRRHGPYRHIHNFVVPSKNNVYTISDFNAARFDLRKLDNMPRIGSAIINRVTLGADSLLSGPGGPIVRTLETGIAHTRDQIRFNWGSTSHLPVLYRRFQTKLEGFDREWSEWSEETRREYTNLSSGTYTFIVRTRDIYERVGDEARFTITILPPWYATIWAYLAYIIFFIVFVTILVRWRTAALETTITERTKEIEAKKIKAEEDRVIIEKQAEKLKEEEKLRARLFANIAHEFRTPITISGGLVEKFDGKNITNPEEKQNLQIIRRNIRRLSDMVDQVIDVTKLDNNVLQLRPKVLRAGPFIRRIAESFRSLTDAKKQIFKIESLSDDILIQTDPDKFETVLNNLIFNAIKFTPEEGVIQLNANSVNGTLNIRITDTGPGIPDEMAESIFNRFYRFRNEETPYQEGMGIGLELSRSLARAMNGDLYLEKGRKSGSCFVFRFSEYTGTLQPEPDSWQEPINRSRLDATGLSISETEPEKPELKHKILLVEDNPDMLAYISGILNRLGEIRMASDGIEALQILKNWEPDLIVSDLMMPNMNGYDFVQNLEKDVRLRAIPVIILTAKPFMEDKLALLRAGVVDYLTKPFNGEELLLRATNALKTYASRKEIRLSLDIDTELEEQIKGDAERAAKYIREHLDDAELKSETLAKALNVSLSTLKRTIKAESGMTPLQFIREIRLQYARQVLINNPKISLDELTESVGFQKTSWFAKLFEERFGVKPGEIR
ncbi:MAG: response regulator [Balneolales bacterium]|nr:response regulator [Balneolales bacterium]